MLECPYFTGHKRIYAWHYVSLILDFMCKKLIARSCSISAPPNYPAEDRRNTSSLHVKSQTQERCAGTSQFTSSAYIRIMSVYEWHGQIRALPFRRLGGVFGGAWPSVPAEGVASDWPAPKLSSHALSGTAVTWRPPLNSSGEEYKKMRFVGLIRLLTAAHFYELRQGHRIVWTWISAGLFQILSPPERPETQQKDSPYSGLGVADKMAGS